MRAARMGAGDIGVQAFDAMGEAMADHKVQRAIGGGGLRAQPFGLKPGKDIIGTVGAVVLQQQFQNAPAGRRQARFSSAQCFSTACMASRMQLAWSRVPKPGWDIGEKP
ncbi:hypothetical protein D9R08_16245 [Rhodophyticola porphyridii]|uniref:Uncharacterized protein n=1 Tax=Rhodophyticola porphyridii TaxID=1852017 RepID=A0A3L9Y1S7_9RHOB|nr:hypothetical protein D9R08_16245 [Rhodophyticola porphyridii]